MQDIKNPETYQTHSVVIEETYRTLPYMYMLEYFLYVLHPVYVVITCKVISYLPLFFVFLFNAFLVLVPLMYLLISLGIFINVYHLVFVVYKVTLFYCKSECSKIKINNNIQVITQSIVSYKYLLYMP